MTATTLGAALTGDGYGLGDEAEALVAGVPQSRELVRDGGEAWLRHSRRQVEGMVAAVVSTCHPERIILFGSRARPGAPTDADVDLLIVASHPLTSGRQRLEESARISRALLDFDCPIDILLYSREEVEARRNDAQHVLAQALRSGIVVYDCVENP